MKLIIDIDKELKSAIYNCGLFLNPSEKVSLINAINNGTPIPDNATNGDVIKAMFPNLEIKYTDTDEYTNKPRSVELIVGNTIITRISADRWNAPYKVKMRNKE